MFVKSVCFPHQSLDPVPLNSFFKISFWHTYPHLQRNLLFYFRGHVDQLQGVMRNTLALTEQPFDLLFGFKPFFFAKAERHNMQK